MRTSPWLLLVAGSLLSQPWAGVADAAPPRPNLVLIMADDMGFSDLGSYGGEIETPHLDRLAAEGLRFSQFYNCALCGPTRAALMTGIHPHQAGVRGWTGLLGERCVTVFELLKQAGYATCAVGRLDMVTSEVWHDPEAIGRHVDRFFGSTGHRGPANYFAGVWWTDFYRDGEPYPYPSGAYKTDLITDFAVDFIRGPERDRERPFLLYLSHYAPHWPLHAKPEDIAKYRDLYRDLGWDRVREARLERLEAEGLVPPGTRLSPRDARAGPWEEAEHPDWEAERMAVYAAQVDSLDQSVGRVMEALREAGEEERTLVLFFSDNGASDTEPRDVEQPDRPWRSDGVPTRVGNRPDIVPGPGDTFGTAGAAWSCVANTPFRRHKASAHEGGIASPLVAWWPGEIREGGGISDELSHVVDIAATVLDLAGADYPETWDGREVAPLAGRSLAPLWREGRREGHGHLCWRAPGGKAVREGNWKLVATRDGPWELYDLSRDRTELEDLAAERPGRVERMEALFEEWRRN